MKRLALITFLLLALPAAAAKSPPCTVVPDPVSLSQTTTYTISATGGMPLEWYEIIISQRFDGVTDEGRDALVQADETGFVAYTFLVYPWVAGNPSGLLVGDARVAVSRYRTGGGPGGKASTIARCTFEVVS